MAHINPFSTQTTQSQATAGANGVQGGGKGGFSMGGGVPFWDFLLAGSPQDQGKILAAQQQQQIAMLSMTAQAKTAADVANMTLPGSETDIILDALGGGDQSAIADIALFIEGIDNAQKIDAADLRVERIQKRIDALNKLVNHLTRGLPVTDKNAVSIDTLVARLDQHIEKLEVHLRDLQSGKAVGDQADISLLIAMGMTPAQMAKMSQRIDEVEKKLGRELTVEDLVAGVANIVPLPQDQNKLLLPVSAKNNLKIDPSNIPGDAEPTDELAAQLNGLTVGVGNDGSDLQMEGDDIGGDKRVMRGLELLQKLMTGAQHAAADGSQKAAAMVKSGFSTLMTLAGASGDIALPSGWYQNLANNIDFSSFDIQAGLPLTSAAQAAHVTTSVQQAGHAHPATHIVSAQMNKAAQEGSSQTMTIQLDPPELGRVDVRLEFGPDKTVKAHLVVEKVETLHMLQRDAAFLDRALTQAGLDTGGGSSLSFELAQDRAFDHGGGERGAQGGNGNGNNGDADDAIIQSTMTWQVDPDTGHVRYNILA